MQQYEITKHKRNEASIERRRYNVFLNNPENFQNKNFGLDPYSDEDIKIATAKRDELTLLMHKLNQEYLKQYAEYKQAEQTEHLELKDLESQNALLIAALKELGVDYEDVLNASKDKLLAGTKYVNKDYKERRKTKNELKESNS